MTHYHKNVLWGLFTLNIRIPSLLIIPVLKLERGHPNNHWYCWKCWMSGKQRGPWSDAAYAASDLGLRCLHWPICTNIYAKYRIHVRKEKQRKNMKTTTDALKFFLNIRILLYNVFIVVMKYNMISLYINLAKRTGWTEIWYFVTKTLDRQSVLESDWLNFSEKKGKYARMRNAQTQISLRTCAGWSGSTHFANTVTESYRI